MAARGQWLSRLPARTGWTWLVIGVVAGLARYFSDWDEGGLGPWALPSAEWEAFIATGLSVGLIVLFRECFARPSRLIRWAAPNAYGVYVIQLFVLVPLQMALLPVNVPPLAKFLVVSVLSIVLCFLAVNQLRRIQVVAAVL